MIQVNYPNGSSMYLYCKQGNILILLIIASILENVKEV